MEIKKYVLPLHPQSRNTAYDLKAQRFFKKGDEKKVHQKFGGLKNLSSLCNRFRLLNWRDDAKGS